MNKTILIYGIIVLFILTALAPMTIGYNIKISGVKGKKTMLIRNNDPPPEEEWNRTFGYSNTEEGYDVKQTSDGGFIIAGKIFTSSPYYLDAWLIKTDSEGNDTWIKKYGGTDYEVAYSVLQTSDDGYIFCGYTGHYNNINKHDVWLVKIDSSGDEQWNKTYGGLDYDNGLDIEHTYDGCYIITGYYGGSLWLLKVDSNGNELWNQTFGYPNLDEFGYAVEQTSDGGFIITGKREVVQHYQQTDLWLIKTDSNGIMEWNKTYGDEDWDWGNDVLQTDDGGYIIVGALNDWEGLCAWMFKTDSNGTILWEKKYYDWRAQCFAKSVYKTLDGGYILLTNLFIMSEDVPEQIWLIKTDDFGRIQWDIELGNPDHVKYDGGWAVLQTNNEGYIITGFTESFGAGGSDVWLIKIGPDAMNQAPSRPNLSGPTSGRPWVEYEYNFSISDPDGDSMHIRLDWEHGTPGKWVGPFPSGSIIKFNYTWRKKGTYTIRAQTMDSFGLLSDWGELSVTMPRDKAIHNTLIYRILDMFPLLERFLTLLIK